MFASLRFCVPLAFFLASFLPWRFASSSPAFLRPIRVFSNTNLDSFRRGTGGDSVRRSRSSELSFHRGGLSSSSSSEKVRCSSGRGGVGVGVGGLLHASSSSVAVAAASCVQKKEKRGGKSEESVQTESGVAGGSSSFSSVSVESALPVGGEKGKDGFGKESQKEDGGLVSLEKKGVTDSLAFRFLDWCFSTWPLNRLIMGQFRSQQADKAEEMGLPWRDEIHRWEQQLHFLEQHRAALTDANLEIPRYYAEAPIHAYEKGNLCWDSAIEEDLWAKLMIAPLFGGSLEGDELMREVWLSETKKIHEQVMQQEWKEEAKAKRVIDLGCGTGLSLFMAARAWPAAPEYLGIDLSPFKLAVTAEKLERLEKENEKEGNKFSLKHAAAESSGLPSEHFDVATLCLVNHESPLEISRQIFEEGFRLLKPGGVLTVLDLDKRKMSRLLTNPFVAAAYKQTEPFMDDFLQLDFEKELRTAGFPHVSSVSCSASHTAFVAVKGLEQEQESE